MAITELMAYGNISTAAGTTMLSSTGNRYVARSLLVYNGVAAAKNVYIKYKYGTGSALTMMAVNLAAYDTLVIDLAIVVVGTGTQTAILQIGSDAIETSVNWFINYAQVS